MKMEGVKKNVGAIIPIAGCMLKTVLSCGYVDVHCDHSEYIMNGALKISSPMYIFDGDTRRLYGFFRVTSPPDMVQTRYGTVIRVSSRSHIRARELLMLLSSFNSSIVDMSWKET